jgi:hypothetical protein
MCLLCSGLQLHDHFQELAGSIPRINLHVFVLQRLAASQSFSSTCGFHPSDKFTCICLAEAYIFTIISKNLRGTSLGYIYMCLPCRGLQLPDHLQALAGSIPRINLHITENERISTTCRLYESCKFIRGMDPAPGRCR